MLQLILWGICALLLVACFALIEGDKGGHKLGAAVAGGAALILFVWSFHASNRIEGAISSDSKVYDGDVDNIPNILTSENLTVE